MACRLPQALPRTARRRLWDDEYLMKIQEEQKNLRMEIKCNYGILKAAPKDVQARDRALYVQAQTRHNTLYHSILQEESDRHVSSATRATFSVSSPSLNPYAMHKLIPRPLRRPSKSRTSSMGCCRTRPSEVILAPTPSPLREVTLRSQVALST